MSESLNWAANDFRNRLESNFVNDEGGAIPDAVIADRKRLVDLILRLAMDYDPTDPRLPDDIEDCRMFNILRSRMRNHRGYEGLRHGDLALLRYIAGTTENRVEATGYQRMLDDCKPAAQQILFKGPKGSGKTTKAIDVAKRLVAEGVVDKVITNIEGPDDHPAVEFSEDISRFLEFAREPGEKLAIFDEFSTVGNAYTGQQDVEQVMSRVINAFRKSDGGSLRTVYIGHENDNDIHPLVKKQSDIVIQADGKVEEGLIDCATVFDGWEDYQKGEPKYRVRGLCDIPDDSPWAFDTNYFAHLEFDLDDPENQIDRGKLIDGWERFQEDEDGETIIEKEAQERAQEMAEELAQEEVDELVVDVYERVDSQRKTADLLGMTRPKVRGALDRAGCSEDDT